MEAGAMVKAAMRGGQVLETAQGLFVCFLMWTILKSSLNVLHYLFIFFFFFLVSNVCGIIAS